MHRTLLACLAVAGAASAHIKPGSFSVPGGPVYTPGQNVTLSWSASVDHGMSNYDLSFSSDSGKSWTNVKTGIPGKAANVAVTYSWTVPSTSTAKGMLRVFQVFGGTAATNPSNPGDYTLFSPVFRIQAASSLRDQGLRDLQPALRLRGGQLEIRYVAEGETTGFLETRRFDGSLERETALPVFHAGENRVELGLEAMGIRGRSSVLLLRVGGVLVSRLVAPPVP